MKRRVIRWELFGIVLIFAFGTTLHFWFEWTGYWHPIAIIAAVNESTWEHFKMAFWPTLFLGIIEYFRWGKIMPNFIIGKFTGLLAMPLITIILFYGYTSFLEHSLPADVAVFIASVTGGQLLSLFIILKDELKPHWLKIIGGAGIILMIAVFSTQSYFPRRNFLFRHPGSDEYGILSSYETHTHQEDEHNDQDTHSEDHR